MIVSIERDDLWRFGAQGRGGRMASQRQLWRRCSAKQHQEKQRISIHPSVHPSDIGYKRL